MSEQGKFTKLRATVTASKDTPMIPARYAHLVFSFFLSCIMSLLVSGIATLRLTGLSADFHVLWASAWLSSWMFSYPAVLLVAPIARRATAKVTRAD